MTQVLKENVWQQMKLGAKDKGSYNITSHHVSSGWFNKAINNSGTRIARLRRYHEADCRSIEISRAIDIIAEDVSSMNADTKDVLKLQFDENTKIKKSTISVLEAMRESWQVRTGMSEHLFTRVRKTLKFGATFYLKNSDGTLTELPTERMIGYILSDEDPTLVTHYIYEPDGELIEDPDTNTARRKISGVSNEATKIPVKDLVVFKIGDKPFGTSVIEPVYSVWKKLSMLEDSLVIYRVVRASEKRVYYIDTGGLQGRKREAAIEKQRTRLMQRKASRAGEVTSELDPHSTTEDIFIPTNSAGKGSRVETLPAGQSLGEVRDLEWFHRQLAAGLRVPFSMMDISSPESGQSQFSDMRVGQVYQVEMRYIGHVNRLQNYFQKPLHYNYVEYCIRRDIVFPNDVKLVINEPTSFAKYKEMEVQQNQLNLAASTQAFNFISPKVVMKKYLGMEPDEIYENELAKVQEFGIDEKTYKKMPPEDVAAIVYAAQPNQSILKKYGVEVPEDGGMGGRF